MKETNVVTIHCIECGKRREVEPANAYQVKRCEACQYRQKRRYNSDYVRRKREKAKKSKK